MSDNLQTSEWKWSEDDGHLRGESGRWTKEMCGVTPNRRHTTSGIGGLPLSLSLSTIPLYRFKLMTSSPCEIMNRAWRRPNAEATHLTRWSGSVMIEGIHYRSVPSY